MRKINNLKRTERILEIATRFSRGTPMKVTIDIDCTPEEARAFMGLPDVQPMQKTMLAEMEKRMMAEVERFSPEGMMKLWFTAMPQGADALQNLLGGFMGGSRGDEKK